MVLADGGLCGLDQLLGQFGADEVAAVVAQLGQAAWALRGRRRVRSGIGREQAGGEHAVEAADIAGELGEAEIDQAMQLADAIVEVLAQPVAVTHEFAQGLGDVVVQMGGFGALLEGEAGEALGVDGVGLGALQACCPGSAGRGTG